MYPQRRGGGARESQRRRQRTRSVSAARSIPAARSMSADRSSIATVAAVEECLRRAAVSVRYGALTISVPAELARKALKELRRCTRQREDAGDDAGSVRGSVRGSCRGSEEVSEEVRKEVRKEAAEEVGGEVSEEVVGRGSVRGTERGSVRGREEVGEEARGEGDRERSKASRNWTVTVEAPTLADALDTLPKFRTVFAKEVGEVSSGEIGGERKRIVMHATFACSRATLTPKSIRGATRLVSAEQRQRMAQDEAHRLIQDGFREFAGV